MWSSTGFLSAAQQHMSFALIPLTQHTTIQEMAKRLSKSAPLRQYNSLMIKTKELEQEVEMLQKKIDDKDRASANPKRGAKAAPPPPADNGAAEARIEVRCVCCVGLRE